MSIKSYLLKNLVFNLGDWLLGGHLVKHLKEQSKMSALSEVELNSLQQAKLRGILYHATSTTKFYAPYLKQSQDPIEWLKSFPITTKHDTINSNDEMISEIYRSKKLIMYESSGSSGIRSKVFLDKNEVSLIRAILITWWGWNGYELGMPLIQTGITPNRGLIKTIKDYLLSTLYLDAFAMTEDDAIKILNKAKKKKIQVLFGYASSLYELANVAEKYGIEFSCRIAMSQGDKLFDHYKRKIETVFGCKVVEDYGLNEGIMIGQKKDLPYFYIYTPNVLLEIVNEEGNEVPDGEMGRIIATKLDGYAMPLIRYDTGDLGIKLPKERYPSTRDFQFPLLEKVVGRNTDIIKTHDGKMLVVHTFTGIFEFFPEIKQFQIIQNEPSGIEILFIRSETYDSEILQTIEDKIKERTQSSMNIKWHEVEEIPASKSGKPQLIINNLLRKSLTELT